MAKQDSPEGTVIFGSPEDVQDASQAHNDKQPPEAPIDATAPLHAGVPWEASSEPVDARSPPARAPLPLEMAPAPESPPLLKAVQPRVPKYSLRELENLIRQALAKRAVTGELHVSTNEIQLITPLDTTRFALGAWIESWPRLSLKERQAHARKIAESLQPKRARPGSSGRPPLSIDLRVVGGIVFLLGIGGFLYFDTAAHSEAGSTNSGSEAEVSPTTSVPGTTDTMTRAQRVCAETRARVHQGGSVTVADAEGWVVEISLLTEGKSDKLTKSALLRDFFEDPSNEKGSRYHWPAAKLSTLDTSDTKVRVTDFQLTDAQSKESTAGVTFSFGGALVDAYFSESQRGEYYRIAHGLADGLGATHAALYARCAHEKTHALGSWFLGADAAQASSALVYFMGIFARPRHVLPSHTHAVGTDELDPALAFRSIEKATENLDRSALATLAGSQGGMATGKEGEPVIISFPFRDGNRASRTSRNIARVTSLAR